MTIPLLILAILLLIVTIWVDFKHPDLLTPKALFAIVGIASGMAFLSVVNFWLPS